MTLKDMNNSQPFYGFMTNSFPLTPDSQLCKGNCTEFFSNYFEFHWNGKVSNPSDCLNNNGTGLKIYHLCPP